jgi:transcriptional regulator of acetoin/glycerol metabolism
VALHLVTKPSPEGLRKALLRNGGSITRTAQEFGVSRQTMHKWMRKHGISVDRIPVVADPGAA